MTKRSRNRKADGALVHALEFLDKTPLVDGHNDLAYLIRRHARGNVAAYDLCRRSQGRDTDLPRLREGRVSAQVFAAFVPPREPNPASFALMQIALIRRMNAIHPDAFMPATRASDIARAKRRGRIASLVSIENGAAIEKVVTLGMNTKDGWVEVRSGLAPGELLVVRGVESLTNGAQVKASKVDSLDASAPEIPLSFDGGRREGGGRSGRDGGGRTPVGEAPP